MGKIKNWLITGDAHSQFFRFRHLEPNYNNPETAVIILGDAGFNLGNKEQDQAVKKGFIKKYKFIVYALRGNHEARPQDCEWMTKIYDSEVENYVYIDPEYPTIRFLLDYGVYYFGQYRCLCIAGAYSVDKPYRLARGWHWFENEQLSIQEMEDCYRAYAHSHYDFVFTHTCPYSFQPTDLFLGSINQSTVDNTMELWLDKLEQTISYNAWCFGHYHDDRIELPKVEQFYNEFEPLDTIIQRWKKYDETKELDWWLPLSPKMERLQEK